VTFGEFSSFITWRTSLDVLLVAFVLYQILSMLKGTRAAQVLVGMFVLFVIYIFVTLLELETISWIINKFYGSFIVVVIVLFQDDLRLLLTRLGKKPFFSFESEIGMNVLDEVVNACKTLAQDRSGAIVVFERSINLDRLHDHSVLLDAVPTEQLISSIFQGFSPLHDGAIIIKKSRIHCASAQLPLSKNAVFNKKLGTRHSASVGITEETDAVVLVVSEETGSLSIAVEGQLFRQSSSDAARKTLVGLLKLKHTNSQPKGSRWHRIIFGLGGQKSSKSNIGTWSKLGTNSSSGGVKIKDVLLRFSKQSRENLKTVSTQGMVISHLPVLGSSDKSSGGERVSDLVDSFESQDETLDSRTALDSNEDYLKSEASSLEHHSDSHQSTGTLLNQAAVALSQLKPEDKFDPPAPPDQPPELDTPIGATPSRPNQSRGPK
jgi:diadenylate cyclase